MLKKRIKWNVGNGEQIHVWRDQWLHVKPSTPATNISASAIKDLKVKDLFIPGTTTWDVSKLESLCHPMDISLIKMICPSLTGLQDTVTWLYTTHGQYNVKSGYNILRSLKGQNSSTPTTLYRTM